MDHLTGEEHYGLIFLNKKHGLIFLNKSHLVGKVLKRVGIVTDILVNGPP
jgi:hypothetical protein